MRPNHWWSRPSHLLVVCDNVSYNWAVCWPPSGELRQIWIWLWGEGGLLLADYERRRASPAKLWIWWLAGLARLLSVLSSALLQADWESTLQSAGVRSPVPVCWPVSAAVWARESLPAPGLVSLSLSHYIIAMIWDQCAGRLYTRTLPISVHTVPYDSCKLLYTKLLLS